MEVSRQRIILFLANFNTNNANQVNIMPPGRKKRSIIGSTALMILAAIKVPIS